MTRHGFRWMVLLLVVFAVAATGCGRAKYAFYPVEGTVTKGGRPLRDIEVVFLADPDAGTVGPRARGKTDEAGHYRLRTDHGDDGAVTGTHRVVVLDLEAADMRRGRAARDPQSKEATQRQLKAARNALRVPPNYGSIKETPLRVEIGHETRVFDIVIP